MVIEEEVRVRIDGCIETIDVRVHYEENVHVEFIGCDFKDIDELYMEIQGEHWGFTDKFTKEDIKNQVLKKHRSKNFRRACACACACSGCPGERRKK